MANKPTQPIFPLGLEAAEQSNLAGIINNGVIEHGPDAVLTLPEGVDADGLPSSVRYNSDSDEFEGFYENGGWLPLGGGGIRWEALPHAATTTLSEGRGYLVDNSTEVSTVVFPSPTRIGDSVTICDVFGKFSVHPLTIDPNGHPMYGSTEPMTLSTDSVSATFTWSGNTRGWIITAGVGLGQGRVYSRTIFSRTLTSETAQVTLATNPSIVDVYVDGKRLPESKYTLDGFNVDFSPAIPSGSELQIIQYVPIQLGVGGSSGGGTVITWIYNGGAAAGGETQITLDVDAEDVSEIYVNGFRQQKGLGFTYDSTTKVIFLADQLEAGDEVVVIINGDPTLYNQIDRTLNEVARSTNVRDNEVILSTNTVESLNGKKVIYDVLEQRYWRIPNLPANVRISKLENGKLTYSPGDITVSLLDGDADVRELWKRSLSVEGITLVDGCFEDGAVVTNASDAVWSKARAQCYIWGGALPKSVASGTTPESTGGLSPTGWVSVETVSDVRLAAKTAKLLSQYAHVQSYAGDNAKIIGILEKENCSFEGGQLDINDSFDFSGNKRIRVNKDTTINVVGSVDHVLKFLGNVKWDGLGKLTVNVNHNDKSDRSQSALCFPNAIPTLDNIDIIGANGTSVLVGLPYFGSGAPMNGQGSGKISNVRTFDCGKGVHVYGNANKDTIIITENLYTDPMTGYLNGLGQGGGGNTFYLSYHRQAKNIGGHFEHHPDSFGSNINRSLYGAYEGGFFQGADGALSRGPTFGEDLEFGSIYGGGVSRNCGFSAISADIRKGDGSYPVSRVLIDGWHAIGCGRTLYSQAQDLSFGNIHTKESKASDFLFRINGASPKAVKQIGVITAFDCVNTPVFVWCDSVTSLYLRPELTIHDGTVNQNIPFVADNQSGTNSVIFEGTNYSTVSADYVVPNGQRRIDVNLTSAGAVTTLRLPAARYSNIKNSRYEIFVRGGNGTKILRLLVNNGDGTINGATAAVDIVPAAGAVVKRDVLSLGAGAYLLTT